MRSDNDDKKKEGRREGGREGKKPVHNYSCLRKKSEWEGCSAEDSDTGKGIAKYVPSDLRFCDSISLSHQL